MVSLRFFCFVFIFEKVVRKQIRDTSITENPNKVIALII